MHSTSLVSEVALNNSLVVEKKHFSQEKLKHRGRTDGASIDEERHTQYKNIRVHLIETDQSI